MRKQFKTLAACLLLAAALSLTACGEPTVITEDEMPYGATIAVDKEKKLLPVQYDYRFVPEEVVNVVLQYYYFIQKQDADRFIALQLPLYHDYWLETVLQGEYTDADLLENTHKMIENYFGGDFAFSFIDITDCTFNPKTEEGDSIPEVLDEIAEEAGEPKVSGDIGACYLLTVTRYLAAADSGIKGETETALYDEQLYVLQYQNDWYIMYT